MDQTRALVSILVFLDLALRVEKSVGGKHKFLGFQSLFSWILLSE